jgi:hypothetical protein
MKRARVINKKPDGNDCAESHGEDSQVINTEITKVKPVKFTDEGITVFQRDTRPTDEGLESEVRKPVLFDGRGRHINSESELRGECHVCHKFVSLIFYCSVQGCKKLLCEEHVFIFNESHYCRHHYDEVIMNYDTWRRQKKVSDEKHFRENK